MFGFHRNRRSESLGILTQLRSPDEQVRVTALYRVCPCGAGFGVILVCKKNGWDFKTACDEIDKIIGTAANPKPAAATTKPATRDSEQRAKAVQRVLDEARQPAICEAYLRRRGLTVTSPVPSKLLPQPLQLAWEVPMELPHQRAVFVPPRAAYSHSASLGRR